MTQVSQNEVIRVGDWLVHEPTGEIVGMVEPVEDAGDPSVPFLVHDQASAEWVLEKLSEAEAGVAAIRKRREVLLANLDAMERDHQRRADWLRQRFGMELQDWAEDELEDKKQRSIKTPFGTLAFRRKPARVVVTDEAAAVAYLKSAAIEAVRVKESVVMADLPPVDYFRRAEPIPGFCIEEESDGFSVKTGLL